MKKYCLIENKSIIKGPQDLPEFFANVSNFHILDDTHLKFYGWLPYEKNSEDKPVFVSSNFEILEDKVIENIITRDKSENEITEELASEKENKWNRIRQKRNNLLNESDANVVSDKWEKMDISEKEQWSLYRKELRDIPQNFEDPESVVFPEKPL